MFPEEERYANEIEASLYNVAAADQDGTDGIRYFAFLDTKMPYEGNVDIKISMAQKSSFKLRLRIPMWVAKDVEISINGKKETIGKAGSYCEINRAWNDGDRVSFHLPMTFTIKRYEGAEQERILKGIHSSMVLFY